MNQKDREKHEKKKFLGIYFKCCNLYGRVYKNKAGTAYEGTCPGCGEMVVVPISEGGSRLKMFIAE